MASKKKKRQLLKEVEKCMQDPEYFIRNYCMISHPEKGLIPFDLRDYQEDLLHDMRSHRFNLVLKARQLGVSTLAAAYVLWLIMFRREKNVLTVATKEKTAKEIVDKVKKAYRHLPDFLKLTKITLNNSTTFGFKNGSKIQAASTSSDEGRSQAVSLLIIDEAAHVENLTGTDGMWTALSPTLSEGGACLALSTPGGASGWFYKMVNGAKNNQNKFKLTRLMYDVHPNRDEQWLKDYAQDNNLSKRQIAQEYLCDFLASGETVVHGDDLIKIRDQLESEHKETGMKFYEPKYKTYHDRNYWIWQSTVPEKKYVIAADVARGDAKDYSTFHVLDLATDEIVAEYQGKLPYDEFAELLYDVGLEYNEALLAIENNTLGTAVINDLKKMEYKNIYHSKKRTHEYVSQLEAENKAGVTAGFTSSMKTRPRIVAKMEEYIRNDVITIRSNRLYEELTYFVWDDHGKPQAMSGENDDLVMAFAILCWVRETAIKENIREKQYNEAFLNTITKRSKVFDSSMKSFRGISSGPEIVRKTEKEKAQQQYNKYGWVYKG